MKIPVNTGAENALTLSLHKFLQLPTILTTSFPQLPAVSKSKTAESALPAPFDIMKRDLALMIIPSGYYKFYRCIVAIRSGQNIVGG